LNHAKEIQNQMVERTGRTRLSSSDVVSVPALRSTDSRRHVNRLKSAPISEFKAKDLFRASGLSLLGVSNSHVKKDQQRIRSGQALAPLLLIRDSANGKVIIADGYHRLCAVYPCDEDAVIPCKIA